MCYLQDIRLKLSKTSDVELCHFDCQFTDNDLKENTNQILKELKKVADGIALNFVSLSDLKTVEHREHIKTISGSSHGSVKKCVDIEFTVAKPELEQVNKVLENNYFPVSAIGYSFILEDKINKDLVNQSIQEKFTILSYDDETGMKFELEDDFYVSVCVGDHDIAICVETKYDWQFRSKMKKFNVCEFLHKLFSKAKKM